MKNVKKHLVPILLLAFICLSARTQTATPQGGFVKPGDNLVLENIPPIPVSITEQTARYGDSRSAALLSLESR